MNAIGGVPQNTSFSVASRQERGKQSQVAITSR